MRSLSCVPYPHNPRGRNVAVPALVLAFSPRDLYYRWQAKNKKHFTVCSWWKIKNCHTVASYITRWKRTVFARHMSEVVEWLVAGPHKRWHIIPGGCGDQKWLLNFRRSVWPRGGACVCGLNILQPKLSQHCCVNFWAFFSQSLLLDVPVSK